MSATSKLGSLLRRLRDEKKFTQSQLAEASGISRVQIARLETGAQGRGRPGWETIIGLARAFGVSADEFAKMIEEEKPTVAKPIKGRPRKTPAKPDEGKAPKQKRKGKSP